MPTGVSHEPPEALAALTLQQGGRQTPFDMTECQTVLAFRRGATDGDTVRPVVYRCGYNLMHHVILWLATPRVPISSSKIKEIQRFPSGSRAPAYLLQV